MLIKNLCLINNCWHIDMKIFFFEILFIFQKICLIVDYCFNISGFIKLNIIQVVFFSNKVEISVFTNIYFLFDSLINFLSV